MSDSDTPPAGLNVRAQAREAARERRQWRKNRRRTFLDSVVSGLTYDEIAERAGLSVATVRREVSRLLAERAPESADRYVALQLSRLQKALITVDAAIESGDYKAVPALAVLMGKFDRYYGMSAALSRKPESPLPAQPAALGYERAERLASVEADPEAAPLKFADFDT